MVQKAFQDGARSASFSQRLAQIRQRTVDGKDEGIILIAEHKDFLRR